MKRIFLFLFLVFYITYAASLPVYEPFVRDDIKAEYRWPAIISQPLIKLLGDESCYVTLVEEFHITHIPCLKLVISKVLGLGIVVGGAIVKIPQIVTILKHRSARGLSLASFLLETSAYEIVFFYNTRLQNPFSTYGEVLFMTAQNILITILILLYGKDQDRKWQKIAMFIAGFSIAGVILILIPSWCMALLYAAQIPTGLASKILQIRANYFNQSTGQLSVFAVLNYFAGTTTRAFTTWTELDDPIMLGGNMLASVLNGILVLQLIIYWKRDDPVVVGKAD